MEMEKYNSHPKILIKVNGLMVNFMVSAHILGKQENYTKESIWMDKKMEMGPFIIHLESALKDYGKMEKDKDLES